jgi:hypothetical protein
MYAGIYYIDNNTPNWTLYMDSLPAVEVNDLKVHLGAHQLVASTCGRGAWATNLVGKKDFPQVIRIDFTPAPTLYAPKAADMVNARAVVQDPDGNVAEVKLYWGTDGFNYPNIIDMAATMADTFATVSGIPPASANTNIYLRIMAVDNNNDTAWTERMVYRIKGEGLCGAAGRKNTFLGHIDLVSLTPGFIHTSGKSLYSDFRSLHYPEVVRGESHTLTTQLTFSYSSDSMFAWVDWNGNLEFEESERITMAQIDNLDESYGVFVVPADAVLDTVTMRVRSIYDSNKHNANPCNAYFGEVEDYSLIVKNPISSVDEALTSEEAPSLVSSVFPNPTTGELFIQYSDQKADYIAIFDVLGKRIEQISQRQSENQTVVDLSAVPAGMYILKVSNGNRSETIKIMKQ